MDEIGVDVDERDWMARPLPMLGTSYARLMDEQLMNRHDAYWNCSGAQRAEITSTRRSNAADNPNGTVKVDAGITAHADHLSPPSQAGRGRP